MLVKAILEAEIKAALDKQSNSPTVNPAAARATCAKELADAVDKFVKSASIIYVSGLISAAPGSPVTGAFVGNLN